ncbi:MAG TPA: MlaD family protein, partial [Rhodothermales bacterium]|nr:MlaD family protein [Rhodothermales bacterium]
MKQEIKVGLTVIVTLVALILGVRFFEDLPLFEGTDAYYTRFENAEGLSAGASVLVNGVNVGKVQAVSLDPRTRQVRVEYEVQESARLTRGTTAALEGFAALGGVHLAIKPGPANAVVLANGTEIPAEEGADLVSQLTERAPALAARLDTFLIGAGLTAGELYRLTSDPNSDFRLTLAQLRQTSALLNAMVRQQQGNIDAALVSARSAFGGLNLAAGNANLAAAEFGGLAQDLRAVTGENRDSLARAVAALNASLRRFDRTTGTFETTALRFDTVLARVNNGRGTLGMLLNDSTLYIRLDTTLSKTNGLIEDFRRNP